MSHLVCGNSLNGQPALPVAEALVTRGTPFVFATGYGEVPEPYRGRPMLTKPFQMDGLKQIIRVGLIATARSGEETKNDGQPHASR